MTTVVPIERETRAFIPTAEAAAHLLRRPQTLRVWAMTEAGLIRPIRIAGRLAWPVAAIKAVLGLEVAK